MTFQTKRTISIFSYKHQFSRAETDESVIRLSYTNTSQCKGKLINSRYLPLTFSLIHRSGNVRSFAVAYNINLLIYYDTSMFLLESMSFEDSDRYAIAPTRNLTKPGLIQIHTHELQIENSHIISMVFKITVPEAIAACCDYMTTFLVDFTYANNLPEFGGSIQTTKEAKIECTGKNDGRKVTSFHSSRLPIPKFSMVYNDVSAIFFFCLLREKHSTSDVTHCYSQMQNSTVWHRVPDIASLASIDVTANVLYGIGRNGESYRKSRHPFDVAEQIEDSLWSSVRDTNGLRQATTIYDMTSLSSDPSDNAIRSASGQQLWAAIRSGIVKKTGGLWVQAVLF